MIAPISMNPISAHFFIVSLHVAFWLKPSGLRYVNVPSLRVLEKDVMNELTRGLPLSFTSSWPTHSLLRWASDPYSDNLLSCIDAFAFT